jgi:hypothetical protein
MNEGADPKGGCDFFNRAARGYAPAPAGISTSYDALGRVTGTSANSELGTLTTSVAYNWGFEKTATDARGHSTTTRFQAFDVPSESAISNIAAPAPGSDPPFIHGLGSGSGIGTASARR